MLLAAGSTLSTVVSWCMTNFTAVAKCLQHLDMQARRKSTFYILFTGRSRAATQEGRAECVCTNEPVVMHINSPE